MDYLKKKAIRLRHVVAYAGQCSVCGFWFDDWPGGVCSACQAIGH